MLIESQVEIQGSASAVWNIISDIENASEAISGIDEVEILERPDEGLVGLKWRETRTLYGKTATEVMWITEAVENESYTARAESHGCLYLSTLSLAQKDDGVSLTMRHETKTQAFMAKLLAPVMGLMFKKTFRKLIHQDLTDIKAAVEAKSEVE
ncbi:MAG: SRPBCC family protein [Akkermansiaceae bacterium]